MAVISGVPSRDWDKNPLPPDQMVATRKFVNDLAGSRRVLSHGLLRPNLGKPELEEMERQVKDLKIDAWKMYTGAEIGEKAWRMDDEKVAYPFWEKTQGAGHQEPLRPQGAAAGRVQREGVPAARPGEGRQGLARPELHRLPLRLPRLRLAGQRHRRSRSSTRRPTDPQEIPWISDILRILKRNPEIKNIYFELGSTFSILSIVRPADLHAHARPDDPGRRRRPHPLGHRLDLERQPAEPDRAAAPAEDRRRPDREVRLSRS